MPVKVCVDGRGWTYGVEHELADWDTSKSLPRLFSRSPDHTIVNSNGVAAQPDVKLYRFGGEVNTPPTASPDGQVDCLLQILSSFRDVSVNHRSNLHIHIRVPGLAQSLPLLKKLQQYIHSELPTVIDLIEPIPVGTSRCERKRAKRRKVSHHTFLTTERLRRQLGAATVKEFFENEVPVSKTGKVLWHAQPRCCVNLRQLLQTDTVEFRHFPGTLDIEQLATCVGWCRDFMQAALNGTPVLALYNRYKDKVFPAFPVFDEMREIKYQATASGNGWSRHELISNIQMVIEERFYDTDIYHIAKALASGVSRKRL